MILRASFCRSRIERRTAHRGAVKRGLRGQARDGQRAKASELAQDAELGDAQPRGCQSRIIGGGDRARGASERAAGARCLELQCLELHSRVYTHFRWKCKPTEPALPAEQARKPKDHVGLGSAKSCGWHLSFVRLRCSMSC